MDRLKVPITLDDHTLGPPTARVTLVEYGDYECPYCALAHPVVKLIQQQFGTELLFVFRHFPLRQVHPNAEATAETAEYAGIHDLFWEMHDGLYENQERLGLPLFLALAGTLGLSEAGLREALANGTFSSKVQTDFDGGVRSGVNGTPTFCLDGERHHGSFQYDELSGAIAARLMAKARG